MTNKPHIGKARLDRLWEHLLKIEKVTGKPLRTSPRYSPDSCPLVNFTPEKDATGRVYFTVTAPGELEYQGGFMDIAHYPIYEYRDTVWWQGLSVFTRTAITHWIMEQLEDRRQQGNSQIKEKEDG